MQNALFVISTERSMTYKERVKEIFFEIAERFDFEIDRCEIVYDS